MLRSKKFVSSLVIALLAVGCFWFSSSPATGASSKGISCVIDIDVITTGSTGASSSTTYHKEFTLLEGETLSDDFSTATRFKFFDAGLTKLNGEWVMSVDWFADTTVFNSVDFDTAMVLAKGQKTGKSIGSHTFYTSNQSTQTNFSIVCVAN